LGYSARSLRRYQQRLRVETPANKRPDADATPTLRNHCRTGDGHQTPILTSRWDLRVIVVAHRMFERWRQENFFMYLRQEYLIDALADYQVEPDDPTRSVPNPARKAVEKKSCKRLVPI
jgi:hypothetical protein